jgi:hypothetical protein
MANEMFGIGDDVAVETPPQVVQPTAVAVVKEKPPINVGNRGLMLTNLDEMFRFAQGVIKSRLAPSNWTTPEQVMIGIQYGAELGMSPMQSLQSIAVINGRPTVWGDALPALVWGSGLCEDITETITGTGPERTAVCSVKRKGATNRIEGRFSMRDAETAGLATKAGPWKQYPDRMLKIRARAFCLRDAFADVLRGMAVREELEDYPPRAEHTAPEGYTLPVEE